MYSWRACGFKIGRPMEADLFTEKVDDVRFGHSFDFAVVTRGGGCKTAPDGRRETGRHVATVIAVEEVVAHKLDVPDRERTVIDTECQTEVRPVVGEIVWVEEEFVEQANQGARRQANNHSGSHGHSL